MVTLYKMNIRVFLGGLCLLCLLVTNPRRGSDFEIGSGSLVKVRSSEGSSRPNLRKYDCKKYASRYLDYLILKNSFYYRVRMTTKYDSILSAETDPKIRESLERRYRSSLNMMVSLSREVDSLLDESRELFDKLLECRRLFGEEYSPENIFQKNKSELKSLDTLNMI